MIRFLEKYGYWFLLAFAVGDFALPYVLGILYPSYDPLKQVISVLGGVGTPTQQLFARGEIVTGTLALLACPALYHTFLPLNKRLAQLITAAIAAFGIGECIFTGVFSVNSHEKGLTLSDLLHGLGSGVGLIGLMVFPLLLAYAYRKVGKKNWVTFYLVIFGLGILTTGVNGLSQLFGFAYTGLVQRVTLFFLYLPVVVFGVRMLKKHGKI